MDILKIIIFTAFRQKKREEEVEENAQKEVKMATTKTSPGVRDNRDTKKKEEDKNQNAD